MLIINFEGREAKGLSKGRYDETFAGEDEKRVNTGKYIIAGKGIIVKDIYLYTALITWISLHFLLGMFLIYL